MIALLRYWIRRRLHAACDKRAIVQFHAGYIAGARDERSLLHNAKLEGQLRKIISDSERPAA